MSDPRKNDCAVAAMEELRRAGYQPLWEPRGKHAAIVWLHDGNERQYTVPLTPSDHRAALNCRADVRRIIREDQATATVIEFSPRMSERYGRAVTNSREVADVFDKRHDNVLRDIDKVLKDIDSSDLRSALFIEVYQPDGQGIERRTFDVTRDGFALLAMGFTGNKALRFKLQYIQAFNAMEAAIERLRVDAASGAASVELALLKSELAALADLVFEKPEQKVKKGPFIRPSVLRKLRRVA